MSEHGPGKGKAGRESILKSSEAKSGADEAVQGILARRRCDAAGLQSLLERITDQITESDERHATALKDMQARLSELSEKAAATGISAPVDVATGLESIEKRLNDLAQSIGNVSQTDAAPKQADRSPASAMPAIADTAPTTTVATSAPTPADPEMSSAGSATDPDTSPVFPYVRGLTRHRVRTSEPKGAETMTTTPPKPEPAVFRSSSGSSSDQWDEETANALVKVYEQELGPKSMPASDHETMPTTAVEQGSQSAPAKQSDEGTPARRPEPPVFSSLAGLARTSGLDHGGDRGTSSALPDGIAPRTSAMSSKDRAWLDDRLAEIAAQVEQSLAEIRPDRAIAAIGKRFDTLEERLDKALDHSVAGGQHGEAPQSLAQFDKHVESLQGQVEELVKRMDSLETLRNDVSQMTAALSELPALHRLNERIDEQLADTRKDLTQLAKMIMEREPTNIAEPASAGSSRVAQIHGLIETLTAERREGETATVNVLMALQDSIDRLTDRVAAMETPAAPLAEEELPPVPPSFGARLRARPSFEPAQPLAQAEPEPPAAPDVAIAPAAPGLSSRVSRLRRTGAGAPAAEPAAPTEQTTAPKRSLRRRPPQPLIEEPAAPVMSPIDEETPQSRENVIANARRMRLRAAAQDSQHDDLGLDEALPEEVAASSSGRRLGTKGLGSRPLLAVLVLAPLALGAGLLWGTLNQGKQPAVSPAAPADAPQRAVPNQKSGSIDGDQNVPSSGMAAAPVKQAEAETTDRVEPTPVAVGEPPSGPTMLTAGIIVDSSSASVSAQDVRRIEAERQAARLSAQLGKRAVLATETPSQPAPATPAVAEPVTTPQATPASLVSPASDDPAPQIAAPASDKLSGLPPAQIGPMSLRVAAAKGDPSAEFEVAARYAQGKGVPRDMAMAAEWYQRAASHGSAPAQYRLAGMYERGLGVKVDPARARIWYQRAAETGNIKAMHNLAVMHTQRNGADPDYTTAAHWFREAAERGLSDSQFNLAILRENGLGVGKSTSEAYKWFALAAAGGDEEAGRRQAALEKRMPAADLAAAKKAVSSWQIKPAPREANDPVLAGQTWRQQSQQTLRTTASVAPGEAQVLDLTDTALGVTLPKSSDDGQVLNGGRPANPIAARRLARAGAQGQGNVEDMLKSIGYDPAVLKAKAAGDKQ